VPTETPPPRCGDPSGRGQQSPQLPPGGAGGGGGAFPGASPLPDSFLLCPFFLCGGGIDYAGRRTGGSPSHASTADRSKARGGRVGRSDGPRYRRPAALVAAAIAACVIGAGAVVGVKLATDKQIATPEQCVAKGAIRQEVFRAREAARYTLRPVVPSRWDARV